MKKQIVSYFPPPKSPKMNYIATTRQNHSTLNTYHHKFNKPLSHTYISLPHTTPSPLTTHINRVLFFSLKNLFTSIFTSTKNLWSDEKGEENKSSDSSSESENHTPKDNSTNSANKVFYTSSNNLHSRFNIITSFIIESIQDGEKYRFQKQKSLSLSTTLYKGICNILLYMTFMAYLNQQKDDSLLPIKILLTLGANPNLKLWREEAPFLYLAIIKNRLNIVQLLCKYQADVSVEINGIPLIIATLNSRQWEAVKILINNGANLDVQDTNGCTPLHLMAQNYYGNQIMQQLIDKKLLDADIINALDNQNRTPLHLATQTIIQQDSDNSHYFICDLKNVRLLITTNIANINAHDNQGQTPLHYAAGSTIMRFVWGPYFQITTDCAELLIQKGANINALDNQNRTPLYYAASKGNINCAKLLIQNGADVNALDNQSRTPLHIVNDIAVFALLLDEGADLYIPDKDGRCVMDMVENPKNNRERKIKEYYDQYQLEYLQNLKIPVEEFYPESSGSSTGSSAESRVSGNTSSDTSEYL